MDIAFLVFDILVFAILAISIVTAIFRGFIREMLTIVGVVGGAAAAFFAGPTLVPLFNNWLGVTEAQEKGEDIAKLFGVVPYDMLAGLLAYGIIFIIVVTILSIISHFLSGWAKAVGLGFVDRLLGAVFGLVRGLFIIGMLYMLFYIAAPQDSRQEWFGGARSYSYVEKVTGWMYEFLPESFTNEDSDKKEDGGDNLRKKVDEKFQELKAGTEEKAQALKDKAQKAAQKAAQDSADKAKETRPPTPPAVPSGYGDQQREKLDDLFKQGMSADSPDTGAGSENETGTTGVNQ